jgi:hypothetical protein
MSAQEQIYQLTSGTIQALVQFLVTVAGYYSFAFWASWFVPIAIKWALKHET